MAFGPQNGNGPMNYNTGVSNRNYMTVDVISGGDTAAANYYVMPGYTTVLIDFNEMKLFIKSKDVNGIPGPTRTFAMNEIIQQPVNQTIQNENVQSQIDELKAMIAGLAQTINSQGKQFNNKKGVNNGPNNG